MGRFTGKSCRMLTMFVLSFAFFLLEVIFGYMTYSMALIADSFHMLSDVLALVIAFGCMKISKRTASSKNTFGWVRAEVLGALVNTVFLVALSFSIILESIQRFFQPEHIRDPVKVLIVGALGFGVNIIGLFLFHGHGGHGHSHGGTHGHSHGREELVANSQTTEAPAEAKKEKKKDHGNQMNMHGIWLHVLGDAFGSIVVIINAVVNWKTDVWFLKNYLDPMLSLMMSLIIMGSSIPLLKESALILLQTVPTHINVQDIKQKLLSQFGRSVADVHEFHVWRLTGNKIVATAHIGCRGDLGDYMRLAEKMKEFFHDEGIHSTTIQPELIQIGQVDAKLCALKCPEKTGKSECADETCCKVPQVPTLEVVSANPAGQAESATRFSSPENQPAENYI